MVPARQGEIEMTIQNEDLRVLIDRVNQVQLEAALLRVVKSVKDSEGLVFGC